MRITELSIRRSVTVFSLMVLAVIMGITSYRVLPREAQPDVKIPYVMVFAPYYGTSPADMENLVTRKLETELKGLADLREMTSTSSEGATSIFLEFDPRAEMSDVLQSVRDAVELARPHLPQDVREDLLVRELSADDWPMMRVVVSGDYDPVLLKKTAEDLQEELERIPGVLEVELSGGVEQEVRVDVDPERLRVYGLSLADVKDAISLQNITMPTGEISLGTYDYLVRVPGEFETVEQMLGIVLNPAVNPPVYLKDVADVALGLQDRRTISRLNQVEAVTLAVKKRAGENILRIADTARGIIDQTLPLMPEGTQVKVVADNAVYVRDMVSELENNILTGMILVVGVLFLFLGVTNAIFAGIAIPFAMLISFVVLRAIGYTLNIVVLFSLILALGMLVDNAIVIVENIFRHRILGHGREDAALLGTRQVSGAVTASTLTTVAAFLPMAFWPGITGEFMKYLPITVMITLLSSLLVALVINPVLCSRFMRLPGKGGRKSRFGDRLMQRALAAYEPVLRWALGHRFLSMLGTAALFVVVVTLFAIFNHGIEFFPDPDPTYAYVRIEAPSGTRLEVSDSYVRAVEREVARVPDLRAYIADVGSGGGNVFGGPGGGVSSVSLVTMEFVREEERKGSSREALEDLRVRLRPFTGARVYIEVEDAGPPTGPPVNVEVSGRDFAVLGLYADRIKERIRDIPGLVDLKDNYDRGRPEIRVLPDPDKAGRYGLRNWDIASTVQTALQGEDVSKFRVGEDEYDIRVRYRQPSRRSVEDLESMTVFHEGNTIPLTAFAGIGYTTGLGSISRIDGRRVVTISADAAKGFNGNAILSEVRRRLADLDMPQGYSISYTGESREQDEAQEFLSEAFVIAIMLIFIVLITQFGSVTTPFVILFSVILSLMGVLIGLLVTGTPFGIIMTGVGVISLAGVVVNNAIVLLDYVSKLRDEGLEKLEALIEAGKTRFRPVMLTAVTTVLGLVPLTTGIALDFGRVLQGDFGHALRIGGESSQWWGAMGVAVIFGLSVATFLTLVVVPVMYSSIDPAKRLFRFILWDFWAGLPGRGRAGEPVG